MRLHLHHWGHNQSSSKKRQRCISAGPIVIVIHRHPSLFIAIHRHLSSFVTIHHHLSSRKAVSSIEAEGVSTRQLVAINPAAGHASCRDAKKDAWNCRSGEIHFITGCSFCSLLSLVLAPLRSLFASVRFSSLQFASVRSFHRPTST